MKTKFLALSLLLASLPAMGEDALKQIQTWAQAPEQCSRPQLLKYLRSDDIRVRSAALDFLENVSGQDFGLDVWLPPSDVPQHVQDALQKWCDLEQKVASAHAAPTPQQTQESVELLRTADPDTARRVCLRFAAHPAVLTAAIVQRLQDAGTIPQEEQDRLLHAQYRIHLLSAMGDNAVPTASALTSHVRADTLDALESLRKVGPPALPVVMDFTAHSDALVREVAIDILLDVGKITAFDELCDSLMAETDANILQIAAKRLSDCKATPSSVRFLRQCALSEDEDIALAGLESLAALAENCSDDTEEKSPPDMSRDMLNAEQCVSLLKSPHWRIRAAMVDLLAETSAPFVKTVAKDESIQQTVVAMLQDEDETVRQYAATAIIKAHMAIKHLDALTEYAISTPSMTPFMMALYCSSNKKLPPALLELLPRMTLAEVQQLIQYDEANRSIFSDKEDNHRNFSPMMMGLLANPDAQVRMLLIQWVGREMMSQSGDFADAVFEWLENPTIDFEKKYHFLYDSYPEIPTRYEDRIWAWLKPQFDTPEAQLPERRTLLLMLAYKLKKEKAEAYVGSYILQADKKTIHSFAFNCRDLLPLLETDDAVAIINEMYSLMHIDYLDNCIVYSHNYTPEQKEKLLLLVSSPKLSEDVRCEFFGKIADSIYDKDSLLYTIAESYVDAAVADNGANRFSCMIVVTACCQSDPIWDELKEKTRAVIPQLPADLQAFIKCVENLPTTAQAVEPWAEKYADSEHVCVRRVVACCLLPLYGAKPFLIFEGERPIVLDFQHPMSRMDLKRKSCPVSLIRLVDNMQKDPDALVSVFASASMLYRTGDCDRARFSAHLAEIEKKDATEERMNYILEHTRQVLNEVWKRWHEHRNGVEEPFKLKGSPKKLKPDIEKLLVQLNKIADYNWGLIPEVKKYVSADKTDGESIAITASDFHFTAPAPEVTQTPPSNAEQTDVSSDESDADESPIETVDRQTPVKVELFHTKGCNDCKQAMALLDALRATYPKLHVTSHDIESDAGKQRNLVLCERYGVPAEQKRKAPIIFAESGYIYGAQITKDNVLSVLDAAIAGKSHALLVESAQTPQQPAPASPAAIAPAADLLADTQADEAEQVESQLKQQNIIGYVVFGLGSVLFLLAAAVFFFAGRRKRDAAS